MVQVDKSKDGKSRIKKKASKKFRPEDFEKHIPLLKSLKQLDGNTLDNILPHLNNSSKRAVCECVSNVYHNVDLNKSNYVKANVLPKFKEKNLLLEEFANPKTSINNRLKKVPSLGGGLITAVLSVALPLLIEFVGRKIFSKKPKAKIGKLKK